MKEVSDHLGGVRSSTELKFASPMSVSICAVVLLALIKIRSHLTKRLSLHIASEISSIRYTIGPNSYNLLDCHLLDCHTLSLPRSVLVYGNCK